MQSLSENGNERFLELVDIASPCPVNWASMSGDDQRRFCSQCKLHVYNLSEMSERQAEEFLRKQSAEKKRSCLRFFRRADGTILTKDCHTIRAHLRRTLNVWFRLTAVCASFLVSTVSARGKENTDAQTVSPVQTSKYQPGTVFLGEATIPTPTEFERRQRAFLNFENALRSETIVVAEYKGYNKSKEIRWNSPPQANFHITKTLKGKPIIADCPIRYAFHIPDLEIPPDWKFHESQMPELGSKWILFIESAKLERGQYNTYWGSYGRQPATEANLQKLNELLANHDLDVPRAKE
jgi:hypothetical protein